MEGDLHARNFDVWPLTFDGLANFRGNKNLAHVHQSCDVPPCSSNDSLNDALTLLFYEQ